MKQASTVAAIIMLAMVAIVASAATVSTLTINVTKNDKPVADAVVELWLNGTMKYRGTTDANGTVTFSNVTTGDYTIYVYVNGSVYRFDKSIDENTTEINITLGGIEAVKAAVKTWYNNYYVLGSIAAAFIFGILIAYGLSGKKLPRRR